MRTLDLDQYWPAVKRPDASSGPADGDRIAHEPQRIAEDTPADPRGGGGTVQVPPVVPPRDRRMPMIWGGLGFVAGMFVWHMIGFWTFISHVAFNDDARVATTANTSSTIAVPLSKPKPIAKGNSLGSIHAGNCIALEIDRTSGDAKPGTCPVDEKPLADAGRTRRDDLAFSRPRLQDPQIGSDVTAVGNEVAAETIDESSFDLTIRPGP